MGKGGTAGLAMRRRRRRGDDVDEEGRAAALPSKFVCAAFPNPS